MIDPDVSAASIEQYRGLALALQQAAGDGGGRVALITSALPGEGKTLTAANLALTLGRSYSGGTLLIDGDLRRPSLRGVFERLTTDERSDVVRSMPTELVSAEHLTLVDPKLTLLRFPTDGIEDPVSVLSSPAMSRLISWGRESFEWVLIDSPPATLVPDPVILARLADTVLLVVLAASTPADAVKRAVSSLGQDRIAGVVLNRMPPELAHSSLQYYGYYDSYQRPRARRTTGAGLTLR